MSKKLINYKLVINGEIRKNEEDIFFEYKGLKIKLPKDKNIAESYYSSVMSITANFGVKFTKNGVFAERSKTKENSMSLDNDLKINYNNGDEYVLNGEMPLISLYELNDSELVDEIFYDVIDFMLLDKKLDEELKTLTDDWTEDEARKAFEIYKYSKKVDPMATDIMIDDYIKKGYLNRSKGAIKFKLANFKNLETDGDEGLDNIGKVFIKVFNEG